MSRAWERLGDSVFRCRLPFLDVTVGVAEGRSGVLLIDTGTTLTDAKAINAAWTRTSSAGSEAGCSTDCDAFQSGNVT